MDIISAHQHGLIEQLDEEAASLAGMARDFGQRAVVLHHLYDHSRGAHEWALAEARRNLRIQSAIGELQAALRRWGWLTARREASEQALAMLAQVLGEASQRRCSAAHRAYRMSATPALRGEAERLLPGGLLEALDACHRLRRSAEAVPAELRALLAEESEAHAAAQVDPGILAVTWGAVDVTGLKRAARRRLAEKALQRAAGRDRKLSLQRIERSLRFDPALPTSFRANPAQHFYALQRALADRRRQHWQDACDREPDAFELAA